MAGTGFRISFQWNVDSRFQSLARFRASYIMQTPAVKKVDNAIHRINLYPVDRSIGFANTYPVDSAIHLMNNWVWIPNFRPLNWFRISLQEKNTRVPEFGLRYTSGYPLLTVFCSAALEIRGENRTWYHGCLDSFLWKCYPRKRIHCTCHLVTLNIFHWVKNLRCHLCFLPVRILDGCYFLYNELNKKSNALGIDMKRMEIPFYNFPSTSHLKIIFYAFKKIAKYVGNKSEFFWLSNSLRRLPYVTPGGRNLK